MNAVKNYLAFKIINFGIWLLPDDVKTLNFIVNAVKVGYIKHIKLPEPPTT